MAKAPLLLLIAWSCGGLSPMLAAAPVYAAEALSPSGIAWIEICIADREEEGLDPVKLRKYCACMQGIVEDNEPLSVTELERSYPPAHLACKEEAGMLR